ncbi:transcriptional regulator [Rhizocola hellebori]|uniref:Transcriptional regulator n=1 Tax=Rhizocola hellebori TaxID=1392758 RepID=A0A8J3QJT7_9ACTN|nr:MerR family transcriptional regulator [Rhizocola hellebori]GIH11045.1 transcriptional regulator [Rhizocola hellebori]
MVELTIDELAQRAGTKTSTIRMYQTRGLLPGPVLQGRVGFYDESHLSRLRMISRLQDRGYSLAAIKDLVDGWDHGANLADVLGLIRLGEPAEITAEDLAAIFPAGAELDPALAKRAMALGLLEIDGSTGAMRSASARFLKVGKELASHGVPAEVALDQYEALAADTRRIADRFVDLFEQHVLPDGVPSPDELAAQAEVIARFQRLAAEAVQELLTLALTDAARTAIARRVGTVSR